MNTVTSQDNKSVPVHIKAWSSYRRSVIQTHLNIHDEIERITSGSGLFAEIVWTMSYIVRWENNVFLS